MPSCLLSRTAFVHHEHQSGLEFGLYHGHGHCHDLQAVVHSRHASTWRWALSRDPTARQHASPAPSQLHRPWMPACARGEGKARCLRREGQRPLTDRRGYYQTTTRPARAAVWPATTTATGCYPATVPWPPRLGPARRRGASLQPMPQARKRKSHIQRGRHPSCRRQTKSRPSRGRLQHVRPAMDRSSSGSRKVGRQQGRGPSLFLTISDLQPHRGVGGVLAVGCGRRGTYCTPAF